MTQAQRDIKRKLAPAQQPSSAQQALLVYIPGSGLPGEVYEQYDLATIEDQLIEVTESQGVGEFDGNDVGPDGAILYMCGPDDPRLLSAVEPVLSAHPICQNARAVIRAGEPGEPEREVMIAGAKQAHRPDTRKRAPLRAML